MISLCFTWNTISLDRLGKINETFISGGRPKYLLQLATVFSIQRLEIRDRDNHVTWLTVEAHAWIGMKLSLFNHESKRLTTQNLKLENRKNTSRTSNHVPFCNFMKIFVLVQSCRWSEGDGYLLKNLSETNKAFAKTATFSLPVFTSCRHYKQLPTHSGGHQIKSNCN